MKQSEHLVNETLKTILDILEDQKEFNNLLAEKIIILQKEINKLKKEKK